MKKMSLAIAVLTVGLLSGCFSAPGTPDATPTSSSSPTPSETPMAEGYDPSFVPEPIQSTECHPHEFAAQNDPEQVAGTPVQTPVDGGPQEYAMGTTILGDDGVPAAYTVGSGDISEFIADRFCINTHYLYAINQVRRDSSALFVGDTLNLDAHTITSVGNQDGVVSNNPPPVPIPPQR